MSVCLDIPKATLAPYALDPQCLPRSPTREAYHTPQRAGCPPSFRSPQKCTLSVRNTDHPATSCHKGAGRVIEGKPHFHVSVKTRMEALGYKPEAEWEGGEEAVVWVE